MGSPITFKYLTSEEKIAGVMILLIITTPIALYIGHINYDLSYWGLPPRIFNDAFRQLPWIRMTILLCFVTYLSATSKEIYLDIEIAFFYVISIFLMTYVLIYPTNGPFGDIWTKERDYLIGSMVVVGIVHGFGYRTIRNIMEKDEIAIKESKQDDYINKSKYSRSLKKMISENDIDRSVVVSILEKIGTEASLSLVTHEVVNARVYGLPIDENHWYFYVESPLHQLHGLLTSAWLIVVSKDTHEIIYNGSANDEG